MRYEKTDYTFVQFEPSQRLHKKYNAIIQNRQTGRTVKIPFGDTRYEQYKDTTGLGLWSHKNHGDKARRKAYVDRHRKDMIYGLDYYTPGYFSMRFLW